MLEDKILHDRYSILDTIAKKAGRRTLLGLDLRTEKRVIIKLLIFGPDFEWDDLKLFEREAETLRHLNHDAIPKYLDYFDVNEADYKGFALVQQKIEARSLDEIIKDGRRFSEEQLQDIARQVLEILTYLHSLNPPVIHRDIKPSNILLGDRSGHSVGKVYLIDFGSVQNAVGGDGGTMTIVGTYGYMPPEQFGSRTVPASDLYSLGATLIYLATGTQPSDLPQRDGQIIFEDVVGLSQPFTSWIKKLIQPSLDKRFPDAKTALQSLSNLHELALSSPKLIQPANSKINLKKSADKLEMIIPPVGFSPGMIFIIGFAIAWNSFLIVWTIGFSQGGPGMTVFALLVLLLFSIPFWLVGLGMIGTILGALFGQTKLTIDDKTISLVYKILGFTYRMAPTTKRDDIDRVEVTPIEYRRDSDGDRVNIHPKLRIWAGARKYEMNPLTPLSEPELQWLAHEFSQWLGVPLNINPNSYD